MQTDTNTWEQAYQQVESLWHLHPDPILVQYATLVPKSGKVIDLGMGEGRNALFFAQMGYEVKGIDISVTAVERCAKRARDADLRLSVEVGNLRDVDLAPNTYSLIIASMVLQFFKQSEAMAIIACLKQELQKDGLLYLSVFSIEDPGYERLKRTSPEVEENTFYSQQLKGYVHYFQKAEILSYFPDWKLIYCAQTQCLDLGHGGSGPHYHGIITYCGQKIQE